MRQGREPPPHRSVALTFVRGTEQTATLAPLAASSELDPFELGRAILMTRRRSLARTPYVDIRVELAEPAAAAEEVDATDDASSSPSLVIARVRSALVEAVSRAIGEARRVAVLTGGGLDSSALLGLAHGLMRSRGGSAFAVALDFRADGDDRPYLRQVTHALGCDVVRVAPEDATAWKCLVEGVDAAPFTTAMGPLEVEAMTQARAHGAERLLTGAGGDELFDGHPTALAELVERKQARSAARRLRRLRGFEDKSMFRSLVRPLLAARAPSALRLTLARRRRPYVPTWAGPLLRDVVMRGWAQEVEDLRSVLARGGKSARAPTDLDRMDQAWYRHQQELAGGLPRCDPFLDHALVRTVHALPAYELLAGDVRRGLFRETIRGLVPESLRTRQDKAAFEPAMFRWVRSVGGFEAFASLGTGEKLAELGLVEPTAFRRAFDAFSRTSMVGYDWATVWPALCVEAFLRAR